MITTISLVNIPQPPHIVTHYFLYVMTTIESYPLSAPFKYAKYSTVEHRTVWG